MNACTRKRGNVYMSESGTCITSTSSLLTLRAHYVHHSSSIPCNPVFTCAGEMQESPNPPETRRRQPQRVKETTTVCVCSNQCRPVVVGVLWGGCGGLL